MDVDIPGIGVAAPYPWPEESKAIISEYKQWIHKMKDRISTLETSGPTGAAWPPKPKEDVRKLDLTESENRTRKQKVLRGQDLHNYLVRQCVDSGIQQLAGAEPQNLTEMATHLKVGWSRLKIANNGALCEYVKFGLLLNRACASHKIDKDCGKTEKTFGEWLHENVKISEAQARKIRTIADLLHPYPKLQKLGLSFAEVYNRRKDIQTMLDAPNRDWANYWKRQ